MSLNSSKNGLPSLVSNQNPTVKQLIDFYKGQAKYTAYGRYFTVADTQISKGGPGFPRVLRGSQPCPVSKNADFSRNPRGPYGNPTISAMSKIPGCHWGPARTVDTSYIRPWKIICRNAEHIG